MGKGHTFDDLTPDQQRKITELVAELERRPTAEALVTCLQLRGVNLNTEEGIAQSDEAMRSAQSFEKLKPYLAALRFFNAQRRDIGMQIYNHMQHPYPTSESEVAAKAHAELMAAELAGVQEVMFHYFCISTKHVLTYLSVTAEASGHTLPEEDVEFLDHYRDLRDHYEHYYNRLPGRVHADTVFTRTVNGVEYRLRGGLRVDDQGRLILGVPARDKTTNQILRDADGKQILVDKTFDVTDHGMDRINEIVERNYAEIRRKAFARVHEHFIQNPENIPSPEDIPFKLLTEPGSYSPGSDNSDNRETPSG